MDVDAHRRAIRATGGRVGRGLTDMTRRLRVGLSAHLASWGTTYRSAGVSRYVQNLIPPLSREPSVDLIAFVGGDATPPDDTADLDTATIIRTTLPTHRPFVRIAWEQALSGAACAAYGVELYHGPAYALPIAGRRPMVVTVHDLSFERHPAMFNRGNRLYLRLMTRLAARKARRIIAVSEFTRDELRATLGVPPDRVDVVHNGIDTRFRPGARDEVEAFRTAKSLPDRFVLYLGTLEPRKNLVTLVRAFARGRSEWPEGTALVLAGGPGWQYQAILAEIDRLGLRDRVIMPGYVNLDEQPLWYSAAAAFAYPSRYEGFGLPPLEAMACGTPVVCANESSLPEVVGDAAIQVAPTDEVGMARAIGSILRDDDLRRRLSEAGRDRAARFSWTAAAAATARVYERAFEAKR
ncbi:MAG: glycosyltransferase family 1 protein [Chloroflexota bacterium]|nr:MAG: glycosyltransferase family 1 protein [Chloroflexota bacterium]